MAPIAPGNPFQPPPPPPFARGLPEPLWTVLYWAERVGMAIEDVAEKCRLMVWGDSDELRSTNDDWNALAGKIAAARDELVRSGNDVLIYWKGTGAESFGKYVASVENAVSPLTDECAKIAKGLSTAAVEVGKLRTAVVIFCGAVVVAIGVALAAAFGTFGMSTAAILPILGAFATAMIALWAAYYNFFNNMAAAFDDLEPTASQIKALDTAGVIPAPPESLKAVEGWDIKFND